MSVILDSMPCDRCGCAFVPYRYSADRWCSGSCRSAAYRARSRDETTPKLPTMGVELLHVAIERLDADQARMSHSASDRRLYVTCRGPRILAEADRLAKVVARLGGSRLEAGQAEICS